MANANEDGASYSYRALRLAIGLLGLLLPLLLALATGFQPITSVSDYYYTNTRDLLVGVMFFLAMFLAFYRPYRTASKNEGKADAALALIAAVATGLLTLFPTYNATLGHVPQGIVLNFVPGPVSGLLHNVGSGTLFVAFAVLSLFVFTRTARDAHGNRMLATGRKLIRNVLYILFGLGILGSIGYVGLVAITAANQTAIDQLNITFAETLALVLFGLSWLVKGGAFPFLNDTN